MVGGFIALNDDKDDGYRDDEDGPLDNGFDGPTTIADHDLVRMRVSFEGVVKEGDTLRLSLLGAASKVRLWSDQCKTSESDSPAVFHFEEGHGVYSLSCSYGRWSRDIYVEGRAASGGIRDVEFRLELSPQRDGISYIDRLKLTVVNVVIDSPTEDAAVMISTNPNVEADPGSRYPSQYQTEDRKIRVTAHTEPEMVDFPVFLASWDPDDESRYETDTDGGDNADGAGGLAGVDGYAYQWVPGGLIVCTDGTAQVEADLVTTSSCSGDNYFVTAGINGLPSSTDEDRTGTLVAWKRVYLEMDRMFKRGSDLAVHAHSESWGVLVEDAGQFSVGDNVKVFDADHPEGDDRTVVQITPEGSPPQGILLLNSPITYDYTPGYEGGGRGAAVGVMDAGWFTMSTQSLAGTFGSVNGGGLSGENVVTSDGGCFVDCCVVPTQMNARPYLPYRWWLPEWLMTSFSTMWFDTAGEPNVIHVGALDHLDPPDTEEPRKGYTDADENWSWVGIGEIGDWPDESYVLEAAQVLSHELVHQFGDPGQVDRDHPDIDSWDGHPCIMDTTEPHGFQFGDTGEPEAELCWDGPCHLLAVRECGDPL